jgi:hypothetical protein
VRTRRALVAAAACLVLGVALGACAHLSGTLRQQVSSWSSSTGIVGLDETVASDVHDFEGALAAHKTETAKTICGALQDDASQAYVELPSPDTNLTNLLNNAYVTLGQGAQDCYNALGDGNQSELSKSLQEIHSGSTYLTQGGDLLASFGVDTTVAAGTTGQ